MQECDCEAASRFDRYAYRYVGLLPTDEQPMSCRDCDGTGKRR